MERISGSRQLVSGVCPDERDAGSAPLKSAPATLRVEPLGAEPPSWVRSWVGAPPVVTRPSAFDDLGPLTVARGADFSSLRVAVERVADLDDASLEALVEAAYISLRHELARQSRYPIRFWNFVPGILDPTPTVAERYMVFNAGRFAAFGSWFGDDGEFVGSVPAASTVDAVGTALVVHCLAASEPGRPIENPRQRPAYRYSARYGRVPPSFARATVVRLPNGRREGLVAGTASVLGEETVHAGDITRQTSETLNNLAALTRAMCEPGPHGGEAPWDWLRCFRSLRVHLPQTRHARYAMPLIERHFPELEHLELCEARLCRRDLLIEIEGVAALGG